ncbi:TetR/AcrR family transcriptional regulator [Gryllotalpicola daejeonensis]|uniref:TetR/AcrR family transcriptional regulator n=2 Tax=Gryllotalpicola daejeonensis TaxID=993087 RepID=A0ABP7ZIQ1_9MICO
MPRLTLMTHVPAGQTWRSTEKAKTRQRYLDEAARLFASRGFHAVSIDDLGAAVGVSGPALYRHFRGKEAILSEILVGVSERLMAGLEATLAERAEPRETLLGLIDFHVDFAVSERDVIRLQDRELASLPEAQNRAVRTLQRRYLDGWVEVLRALRPEATQAELRVLMQGVFGLLNSTAHNSAVAKGTDVRRILADAAAAVLLT